MDDSAEANQTGAGENELGKLKTRVVGLQYYDHSAGNEEQLKFQRSPDNPHDKNAIEVLNADSRQIGHLPAKLAGILAPLLDRGELRISGRVSGTGSEMNLPVTLHLELPENDCSLLQPEPGPGLRALWHQRALSLRGDASELNLRQFNTALGYLEQRVEEQGGPRARLLVRLMGSEYYRRNGRARQSAVKAVKQALKSLEAGEVVGNRRLALLPLYWDSEPELEFILLREAFESGLVRVCETREDTMTLENRGDTTILTTPREGITSSAGYCFIRFAHMIHPGEKVSVEVHWPHVYQGEPDSISGSREELELLRFREKNAGNGTVQQSPDGPGRPEPPELDEFPVPPKDANGYVVFHRGSMLAMDLLPRPEQVRELWKSAVLTGLAAGYRQGRELTDEDLDEYLNQAGIMLKAWDIENFETSPSPGGGCLVDFSHELLAGSSLVSQRGEVLQVYCESLT